METEILYISTGHFAIVKSKIRQGKVYEVREEMKIPDREYYSYFTIGMFPSRQRAEDYINNLSKPNGK